MTDKQTLAERLEAALALVADDALVMECCGRKECGGECGYQGMTGGSRIVDPAACYECAELLRDHGDAILQVVRAVEGAATGEVVECGDDDEGQPRVLVHSTRDELRKGSPLAFHRVALVPLDAAGSAEGRGDANG